MPRKIISPTTLTAARPRLLPRSLATLLVRLHENSRMSGRPLCDLIPEPSTSGASFTVGTMTKRCRTACICTNPTKTKSGKPAGPNTMLIGSRSSRLRKIVNMKLMLTVLPRNHLAVTFPYPKALNLRYPPG